MKQLITARAANTSAASSSEIGEIRVSSSMRSGALMFISSFGKVYGV